MGGGIAALWTLARLRGRGFRVALIEPGRLGQGQTLASQGIIHGGLKYTLSGLFNQRAAAVAAMPSRWRAALAGKPELGDPSLTGATVLSEHCLLWRSSGLAAALGMIGARAGLQTAPTLVPDAEVPALLRSATGSVYRVDEPVVQTASVLETIRRAHQDAMLAADGIGALEWSNARLRLKTAHAGVIECKSVRQIIVAAGGASEAIVEQLGVATSDSPRFVRRPLHMGLVRARAGCPPLPAFCGHNVDGKQTRVTITSGVDAQRGCVWQVGGKIAEDGVAMSEGEFRSRLQAELREVLPLLPQDVLEFASYRVDRVEFAGVSRQEDAALERVSQAISVALPLKLALAPLLAERIEAELRAQGLQPHATPTTSRKVLATPVVGRFPWEEREWTH